MAAVDVATPVVVAMAKVEAMVMLMLTPHPNKDCVMHLVKMHLIVDTRQQLMRCKHHGRRLCNALAQVTGKMLVTSYRTRQLPPCKSPNAQQWSCNGTPHAKQ